MDLKDQEKRIRELAEKDGRYAPEAFFFVTEAVGHTVYWIRNGELPEQNNGPRGDQSQGVFHVSGQELLAGIRKLAYERWGALAPQVLRRWGVKRCEDFGEIVFAMVEDEKMQWRKRDCDRREDFANGFDFDTAFATLD